MLDSVRYGGGESPKIIFLTDGYTTDLNNGFLWFKGNVPEFNKALREYHDLGINISTVGLRKVDSGLMTKISGMTGGIFVNVQDVSDISTTIKVATVSYSNRDLFSIRYIQHMDGIYGLLRVLFLSIIGSLLLLAYMEDTSIPLIVSAA